MWFKRRLRKRSGLLPLWLGVAMLGSSAWAQSTPPPPEPQSPPALDGPAAGVEAIPSTETPRAGSSAVDPASVELGKAGREYAPQAPPAPVVERPSGVRPGRNSQWIAGNWAWDPARGEFAWVGGSWQIPPAGSVWVTGRWDRDAGGWYWVPGLWSRRVKPDVVTANRPAWRTTGPPADHPDDVPAPAPAADFFYVPGHYAPDGDRLAWTSGFWSRIQPGWDWIPARWVRRPNGWDFREGNWVRDPDAAVVLTDPRVRRRFAARPIRSGQPPAVVESRPGAAVTDRLPPPPGTVTERDPIAGAEAAVDDTDVIYGAVVGLPYYVIRPPGMYPYGPGGVVVPSTVPPFVRRILDRVLP